MDRIQTNATIWLVKHDLQAAYDNYLPIEQRLYRLASAVGTLLNLFELPTTVEPTQTAPTLPGHWDVDRLTWVSEKPAESTIPVTPLSLPSDQVDTKSGPVEHNSECAQPSAWVVKYTSKDQTGWVQALELYCQVHHVSWWFGRTPAPDVVQASSISVKQPLKESVENSAEESVKLPSKKWTIEEHTSWGPAAKPQYGITDGTYHILLPKEETHSMAEQHAKYLTERHY